MQAGLLWMAAGLSHPPNLFCGFAAERGRTQEPGRLMGCSHLGGVLSCSRAP